jgi:hypothetical protein
MRKDRFTDEALRYAEALAQVKLEDAESFAEAYDFARCQRADGTFYPIPDGKQCRKGTKASPIDPGAKRQREGQKPVVEATKKRKSREEKIAELKSAIKGLKAEGAPRRGKLAKLRGDIQEQQRMRKIEADAKKTGKSVDDTIRARQAAADKKIKARLKKEQEKRDQRRKEEEAKPKLKTDFRKEIEVGAAARKKRDEGIMQRQKEEASLRRAYAQVLAKERNARRDGDDAAARKFMRASLKINKRLDEVQGARLTGAAPKRKSPAKKKESSGKGTPEQRMQLERLRDRMDDAVTIKEQQRISSAIKDLEKRMQG